MKAQWVILDSGRPKEINALYDAVERSGREARCLRHVPDEPGSVYPDGSCVVLYGPMDRVAETARARDWTPVAWDDPAALACHGYYGHWGEHVVQQEYVMLPLGEVRRKRDWLYRTLRADDALFVRPDANDKAFGGEMVSAGQFEGWSQGLDRDRVDPAALCVVCRPVGVEVEWRLVVRRGRVVTGSSYRVAGEFNKSMKPPAEAVAFAERVASRPYPGLPNLYVIDVCVADGRLAVMEIGSVNSAGFYGCDLDAIVEAASQEAEHDWSTAVGSATPGAEGAA